MKTVISIVFEFQWSWGNVCNLLLKHLDPCFNVISFTHRNWEKKKREY